MPAMRLNTMPLFHSLLRMLTARQRGNEINEIAVCCFSRGVRELHQRFSKGHSTRSFLLVEHELRTAVQRRDPAGAS